MMKRKLFLTFACFLSVSTLSAYAMNTTTTVQQRFPNTNITACTLPQNLEKPDSQQLQAFCDCFYGNCTPLLGERICHSHRVLKGIIDTQPGGERGSCQRQWPSDPDTCIKQTDFVFSTSNPCQLQP